jgi:2-hydroxychromene-2-carboxylate isomerase
VATISVENFTDAACPFAFSAEPRLTALRWYYGDQLRWTPRQIVLSEERRDGTEGPFTLEMLQGGQRRLRDAWGMPIDDTLRPYFAASVHAARAVVATWQYAPEKAEALQRRLRVLNMGGGQLDDPALIERAAVEAGIDPIDLTAWLKDPDVEIRLRADMAAARDPHPAALAQTQRLSRNGDGWRYSAPSLVFTAESGRTAAVAGFQTTGAYEAVLANLDPTLVRGPKPESVAELLDWAEWPLATAEVAEVMELSHDEARQALAEVADEDAVGQDGYWALRAPVTV